MPGSVCQYINCGINQHYSKLKMYRFPINDKDRLHKWIANSGNTNLLYVEEEKLRNRYICEIHFSKEAFINESKHRLTKFAIPVPYKKTNEDSSPPFTALPQEIQCVPAASKDSAKIDFYSPASLTLKTPIKVYSTPKSPSIISSTDLPILINKETFCVPSTSKDSTKIEYNSPVSLKVKTPTKVYVKKDFQPKSSSVYNSPVLPTSPDKDKEFLNAVIDMPSPKASRRKLKFDEGDDTHRNKKLKLEIQRNKRTLQNKRSQISKYKRKIQYYQKINRVDSVIENFQFPSIYSKTFAKMQFRRKRTQWTLMEKNLALMIFYKSPSTYQFLKSQKIILPAPSTIRKWLGASKFKPGFSVKLFNQLEKKFAYLTPKEKSCVVCFDEMCIMNKLEYCIDTDIIEGFEDLGPLGRKSLAANYCLVFMIRGLYAAWKLPVAYFLSSSGVKATDLVNLLTILIDKLHKIGLLPKVIVCDQGTSNQSALKKLNISCKKPYFEMNDKKIFALFDTPHLFKNFRNNLLTGDFILDNRIISFADIRNTYEIDKKNKKSRALTKITDSHIFPNSFQRMNVKMALQVLSNTMAAAIKTCVFTKELQSNTAENTAEFILFLNNLFDCLNSKTRFVPNPYRSALSDQNIFVMTTLNEARTKLNNLIKIDNNTKKQSKPPCFTGLLQTIEGILQLFDEEKKSLKIDFILTNRLNQDVLENLFSVYRQKGGNNRNPTARTFRAIFRNNAINSLMKPAKLSNCEADSDILINLTTKSSACPVSSSSTKTSSDVEENFSESESESGASVSLWSIPDFNSTNKVTLEECSVTYFAGYLVKKCIDQYPSCEVCRETLQNQSDLTDRREILIFNKTYKNINITGDGKGLKAPSIDFKNIAELVLNIFEDKFKTIYFENNIKKKLTNIVIQNSNVKSWIEAIDACKIHRLFVLDMLLKVKICYSAKLICNNIKKKIKTNKQNPKLRILQNK